MRANTVRILQSPTAPEYDLRGIHFDLARKTGVLIRQSKKGADLDSRESRLRQESLVPVAVSLRGDADASNIILYDEGSGVSGTKGYDKRPQLSRLYLDIANGVVGSIVVARADRLFRDKHFRNVSMFTEVAEKQRIILIVPGRSVYDFTKTRDLQAFQREMQEAYSYLATQIAYMLDTKQQKILRGLYGGFNLPAPYVIDRAMDKDRQVPVIYHPWQPIVMELFERFREYDFTLARIGRYIEERPYLFPYPPAEDLQRYMFKVHLRTTPGGYTFGSMSSVREYFCNRTLGGYAKIGKDAEGNILFLANAFEAAIPLELLGTSYAAITGYALDGTPVKRKRYIIRGHTTPAMESPAVLHGLLQSDDGAVCFTARYNKGRPAYTCHKGLATPGWTVRNKTGLARQKAVWSVACEDLDTIAITRLCELARHDADMSDRIKAIWEHRTSSGMNEADLLAKQIEKVDAQIQRLDKLVTDPEVPLTAETERRYLTMLRKAESDREALIAKQAAQDRTRNPAEVVPNFYHVLAHLPVEYKRLTPEGRKRVARQVIQDIRLNTLSPHLFLLHVTWQTGIAVCPDVALVWRGMTPTNSDADWTPEEDEIVRTLYPGALQVELMRALPQRAWNQILGRAHLLGLHRATSQGISRPLNTYHHTVRYDDLEAAASLTDDPAQQKFLREQVDALARQTTRGTLSAYWLLALDSVGYAGSAELKDTPAQAFFGALPYGSSR